jgi:DNA-binding transcriptional LysR family regulator
MDMLDGMTLDQLRTFIAAVDEGSFSAAGRKLRRAQSVVSHTLANLEAQVGLPLFDRSARYPSLTETGHALLDEARAAVKAMDAFKARARSLSDGLEPELAVSVDVMFPIDVLTEAVRDFQREFPTTPLRVFVEVLGAVLDPVVDGRCRIGIVGTLPELPGDVIQQKLLTVPAVTVCAPEHPLARIAGEVPRSATLEHVQLVLTDRSVRTQGKNFGVTSTRLWRLADLGAKHAFLKAGLGWGHMPLHVVREDIEAGRLAVIQLEPHPLAGSAFPMVAVHLASAPPGPAGRWFIQRLTS